MASLTLSLTLSAETKGMITRINSNGEVLVLDEYTTYTVFKLTETQLVLTRGVYNLLDTTCEGILSINILKLALDAISKYPYELDTYYCGDPYLCIEESSKNDRSSVVHLRDLKGFEFYFGVICMYENCPVVVLNYTGWSSALMAGNTYGIYYLKVAVKKLVELRDAWLS